MAPDVWRAQLEAHLRALQAEQQQAVAQANAATGAIAFCQRLLAELDAPARPAGPKAAAGEA